MNIINNDTQNITKNQNKPCAFHVVTDLSTKPNASRNKWILRRDIKWYVGHTIGGVKITESGILAAAHLAGPGSVKKFLRSGGTETFSDAFGTSIKYYLKRFKGYDTSFVEPNRKAKAKVPQLNNYFTALSEK